MIKDVEYDGIIVRTAQKIFDLGLEGVQEHIRQANVAGMYFGNHTNTYMEMSVKDFHSANILVQAGLGTSVLKRMGMWQIDKYTYYTKSNKWGTASGKNYRAASLEDFIDQIVFRNGADKK